MSFKIGVNHIISFIFLVLALTLLTFTVKVGVSSYQKFLAVDETGVNSTGVILQVGKLKMAVDLLEGREVIDENENEESSKTAEVKKEMKMPKKVEILYSTDTDENLIKEIEETLSDEVEIIKEEDGDITENQVIYKADYGDLKEEMVGLLKDRGMEVKILKRKEDKEIDVTIKLKDKEEVKIQLAD